jgi:hypothetical protein
LDIPDASILVGHVHAVFFPNETVSIDLNFYSPRLTRLGSYLTHKARDEGGQAPGPAD